MANEDLVAIHEYVTAQLNDSERSAKDALGRDDISMHHFFKGKCHELNRIRRYLNDHFNLATQIYY